MKAGELDRRITLYQPTTVRTATGATTTTYAEAATVWARVRASTASEQIRNGLTSAAAPHAIRIRYRTDVDETWRIGFEGRTLEIGSVIEFGRREALDIVATELRE